jgi:hypothetical protein
MEGAQNVQSPALTPAPLVGSLKVAAASAIEQSGFFMLGVSALEHVQLLLPASVGWADLLLDRAIGQPGAPPQVPASRDSDKRARRLFLGGPDALRSLAAPELPVLFGQAGINVDPVPNFP